MWRLLGLGVWKSIASVSRVRWHTNFVFFQNGDTLSGAVVLMWRGGCSFVDKVRRAQKAGALACVVVQTMAKWPFSMSDTSNVGGDIGIPSAMLCSQVGPSVFHMASS